MIRRVLLLLALCLPGTAHAHASFPAVTAVGFRPGAPGSVIVGLNFGAMLTHDDGATWEWICDEAVGYSDRPDATWVWLASGTLLSATMEGVARSTDGGCSWAMGDGTDGLYVDSLRIHPAAPDTVLASASRIESDGTETLLVLRSHDAGEHFDEILLKLKGRTARGLVVSPSHPEHLYVSTYSYDDPIHSWMRHSDDGGETWTESELEDYALHLLAIDPADPLVLYVAAELPNRLLRSADGGETFTEVLATTRRVAAVYAAGTEAWAAEYGEALYHSIDSGLTFVEIEGSPPAACIDSDGTELYACAVLAELGFVVGRTLDGVTYDPFVPWFDVIDHPLACPQGTDVERVCTPYWPQVAALLGIEVDDGEQPCPCDDPACACEDTEEPDVPEEPSGCACDASTTTPDLALLALIVLLVRARRR